LVPEDAVVGPEEEGAFVFVVTNRNAVERRAVKSGSEEDGWREIKEGLAAGDWVIIQGLKDLQPGMAVQPERVSAPKEPKE
jgi:multidrug efflux pump subunit AcrA (membrane-fusion protein)